MEEDVFKALADANRRVLLDALFIKDGQTLNELCDHLAMTRFGVMKHLQVLESAELIVTRKHGREKLHYLNAVPIQHVYERWVGKYMQPWAAALTTLKSMMEKETVSDQHLLQIFIQTTPERLWQALTQGELTAQYYFGSAVESDWQPGSPYRYPNPAGGAFIEGQIVESDPPRRLVMTFKAVWESADAALPPSRVTWEIVPVGRACKLTLIHEGMDFGTPFGQDIAAGWSRITSGLKTLLETGHPLVVEA